MGKKHNSVRSAFAGGWSQQVRDQLDNVVIPERVKCKICKKVRLQSFFSKRQLDILRNAMVVQGQSNAVTGPGHATCRECSGNPVVELRCVICDKVKGLDEFAKNQRHDRDIARCLTCVQKHSEAEPVAEENKLLTGSELSSAQHPGMILDGTLAESTKRLALRDVPHAASGRDDESSGWIERGRIDDYNRGRDKGRELATIDPRGNADRLRQSGWASWGITPSDTAASVTHSSPMTPRRDSKFARVKAVKPPGQSLRVPDPTQDLEDSDGEDPEPLDQYL
ncbi:hypothetical protein P168DRAFT_306780 [Aspergillus campestris IBT 28561]|uniref:Stc1 domain-containing protein n=1 Tax=Aspergillus campestris (strain IBT 28561) TaxID=1392248 RepID=A0A2I1CVJ4_ASPC2|nr:uncharacterized protein P168DRAFT_306780 [Aspergillus campestris IBT 28561]PKY01642.1 hypothetical protein P168DRAFT_306780 [Aspergillus campestris IBT 28561]